MRIIKIYSIELSRVLFGLLFAIAFGLPVAAQGGTSIDVTILVSGPWSYVNDPLSSGRLAILAPVDDDHGPAAIFSGLDAIHSSGKPTVPMGYYSIDIPNLQSCSGPPGSVSKTTFPIKGVDPANTIKPALQNPSLRYAFSLPQPCSYISRVEALQKIGDASGTAATQEKSYTILMELHYLVSSVSPAHLWGTSDGHHVYSIFFDLDTSGAKHGLSIVISAPPYDTDFECDSVSAESVLETADLLKHPLSVHFPRLDFSGNQRPGDYSLDCDDLALTRKGIHRASHVLEAIKQLHEYFRNPVRNKLDEASRTLNSVKQDLHGFRGLPPEIDGELARAQKQLEQRASMIQAQHRNEKKHPAIELKNEQEFLPKTSLFALLLTPGAGNCRGAQLNINDALP